MDGGAEGVKREVFKGYKRGSAPTAFALPVHRYHVVGVVLAEEEALSFEWRKGR